MTEAAAAMRKYTDPCLPLDILSFIRNDEVAGFGNLRAGYMYTPFSSSSCFSRPRAANINCPEPRPADQAIIESITTYIHESGQGKLRRSPDLQRPGVRQLTIRGLFDGRRDANSRTKRIFDVLVLGYCIRIPLLFLWTRISAPNRHLIETFTYRVKDSLSFNVWRIPRSDLTSEERSVQRWVSLVTTTRRGIDPSDAVRRSSGSNKSETCTVAR